MSNTPTTLTTESPRPPTRRWLRHLRRAAYVILTLLLLLAAVWGWFYWGWYSERQTLISLKVDPDDPRVVTYTPIVTSWPKEHLGPLGFVLDRAQYIDLFGRSDLTDLTPLARLTNLRLIALNGTQVTDLTPLRGLNSLRELYVPKATITEAQVEALRRDLPDCRIDRE